MMKFAIIYYHEFVIISITNLDLTSMRFNNVIIKWLDIGISHIVSARRMRSDICSETEIHTLSSHNPNSLNLRKINNY